MTFDLDTELKRKGMTGRDLARAINCEEATVSRYRRGLTMTDYHERAIAEALGLVVDGARTPVALQAVSS
jgi:transcriptional regulator with XRE-family HTH domain